MTEALNYSGCPDNPISPFSSSSVIHEGSYEVDNMNRYKKIIVRSTLLVFATTATASCMHNKEPYRPVPIPQDISQGDTFTLLKPLEVESGRTAVYFQQGRVVEKDKIDPGTPYCRLELKGPAGMKLTIQPQNFRITEVTYNERAQGHAGEETSMTYFALQAKKGGQAKRIVCGLPSASAQERLVTPEEIATTLAGYFSIEAVN